MLIHELLNKDADIVPEVDPLIILDSKSDVCVSNNGKDTKIIGQISRSVYFVINGEHYKMKNIEWCEEGLKFADIANNNARGVFHHTTPLPGNYID